MAAIEEGRPIMIGATAPTDNTVLRNGTSGSSAGSDTVDMGALAAASMACCTSAGGGVALGTMLAGEAGATPDFIISIFGPSLQDVAVPAKAPPLFLVTESNHGPVTDGLVALFQMWKEHGHPAELHVYEVPNFSMRVSLWGDRLFDWLRERMILPAAEGS